MRAAAKVALLRAVSLLPGTAPASESVLQHVLEEGRQEGGWSPGCSCPARSQPAAQGLAPGPAVESLLPEQPVPVLAGAEPGGSLVFNADSPAHRT